MVIDSERSNDILRCVLVGSDSLLLECGDILSNRGHEIVAVAAGSRRVSDWARSRGYAVVDAVPAGARLADALAEFEFDWLFSITHLALLPDDVLAVPKLGTINFHDGPLPAYAGLNTPAWALINGERRHGVSWHIVTSGVDEGALLKERELEISDRETSLSLNMKNFEAGIETFAELIDELSRGMARPTPQDPNVRRTTFSRHDRPEALGVLDWTKSAGELDRIVRALDFGPYPNPLGTAKLWNGNDALRVTESHPVDGDGGAPGTIESTSDAAIVVACGQGSLSIDGFADLRGEVVTPADAAGLIGTSGVLPLLDDDTRVRLTKLGEQLSRAERFHEKRLLAVEPVEFAWPIASGRGSGAELSPLPLTARTEDDNVVLTAFAVVLSRLSGKQDVSVSYEIEPPVDAVASLLVSPFAPWTISISPDAPFAEVASAVAQDRDDLRSRGGFSCDLLSAAPELMSHPALADGQLVLPFAVRTSAGSVNPSGSVVELASTPDGWQVRFDHERVRRQDAERFRDCLDTVLGAIVERPDLRVAELPLLRMEAREQVLHGWNDTETAYSADMCVHQLFEAQVDRTPDRTAVVFADDSLTYRQLDERANRLAGALQELGVGPDRLVGIYLGRSIELLVAVLATQKAGGAYVPLDPFYPIARIEHMVADSGCEVIITDSSLASSVPQPANRTIRVVDIDADRRSIEQRPADRRDSGVDAHHLAYCIYTSGSTGVPKGVLIEHRNVSNFFTGMDPVVDHETPATWLAVTSLSFDISVLELLYTVTRGFTVVIHSEAPRRAAATRPMDFSLFYFSGDEANSPAGDKYRLLLEGAKFADSHGFIAVWTPERHFHSFGGLYPQPAVTGAALATVTKNVQIRAGSVVMPLHHPIRVAEAWSMVDNLSNGRVGISVASGWQPNDFVLMPQNFAAAKQVMFDSLESVQRLWRGETLTFPGVDDKPVEVTLLPRPVQAELPVWVTSAGNPQTYIDAGRIGANVLTHLLGQSVEQLADKIDHYRRAWREAGHPGDGVVSLMLHTYIGDDLETVREKVREPLKRYLATSMSLIKDYAWAFPAFRRPDGSSAVLEGNDAFADLDADEMDAVLDFAFQRYFETSGLFGTPAGCQEMVGRLKEIGVDEIACLIDFGVDTDEVLTSLPLLDSLRQLSNPEVPELVADDPAATRTIAELIVRHDATHLQCTPSMARLLTMQEDGRRAMSSLQHVYIGGEAFPVALAQDLRSICMDAKITNMYGPTETTIWSTTWPISGDLDWIPIGTPIANTRIYVLDAAGQPQPAGVEGDLWIGGAGVVRGYHNRAELTAERFAADPFVDNGRMYATGDRARWIPQPDGSAVVEFLGRADQQVKIRGYRIELGEIEARLGRCSGVRECSVTVDTQLEDPILVAYASPMPATVLDADDLRAALRATLPEAMVPSRIILLDDLPHTPNGKIDRKALPAAVASAPQRRAAAPVEAGNDLERQLLDVWEDMLGITGVGVDDNFFDSGGHSLLVVRMHRRLTSTLSLGRPIALTDLYRFPTIRSFAEAFSSDAKVAATTGAKRASMRRDIMSRRRTRG
jgi:natural product biosynthesis luciferase-like monooxygenase protein